MGIEIVEKRITRDEVYIADEAFLPAPPPKSRRSAKSTVARSASAAYSGPVSAKLQKAYFDLVTGKTDAHAEWRTLVK
ncbi:Branched-chain-amino-acid aminotransferase OS=Stutzerimonas stutzeri OX=316 GN=ilvE PE=3 SV=1 [Stutzerimonas stutzeri]